MREMQFHTRRHFLGAAGLLAGLSARAMADDSWTTAHPDEWTPHEIDTVLNHSPWVHEVVLGVPVSALARGRGKAGPIEQAAGVPSEFAALVRWESALPVRLARRLTAAPDGGQTRYLLSISRLPLGFLGEALGRDPDRAPSGEDQNRARVAAAALRTAVLQRTGKPPIRAAGTSWAEDAFSPRLLIEFRPGGELIQLADLTVTLVTQIDTVLLRAVFVPKKMRFRGRLEL
jgi:hypothetical protein